MSLVVDSVVPFSTMYIPLICSSLPPPWYVSPEWWLCILGVLTLLFVGWQAYETRKAAEGSKAAAKASRKQASIALKALILQFRPHVHIRRMQIIETSDNLTFEATLVNKGGSVATVTKAVINASWLWSEHVGGDETPIGTTTYEIFKLKPGESAPLRIALYDSWVMYKHSVHDAEKRDDRLGQFLMLKCQGEITYSDDNAFSRDIGFSRWWNHKTNRFVPSDDPEAEYAD